MRLTARAVRANATLAFGRCRAATLALVSADRDAGTGTAAATPGGGLGVLVRRAVTTWGPVSITLLLCLTGYAFGRAAAVIGVLFEGPATPRGPARPDVAINEATRALVARAQSLAGQGGLGDALAVVEATEASGPPPDAVIELRGELRARLGDCPRALLDFDRVLARGKAPPGVVERALYARAGCRLATGADLAARDDLERLLRENPQSRWRESARQWLARSTLVRHGAGAPPPLPPARP